MYLIRPEPPESSVLKFLLISDLHLGADIEEKLLISELDWARKNKARILINGDVFDAILPQDRKRFLPSVLHPRFQGVDDLVNKVVDYAAELLTPYVDLIDVIGTGNHDALEKHCSVDPVLLLHDRLDSPSLRSPDHRVYYGGYSFFAEYVFSGKKTWTLYAHHGWGKGKGATHHKDVQHMVEGVDMMWLGHLHKKQVIHSARYRPSPRRSGGPEMRDLWFVRTGAYLKFPLVSCNHDQTSRKKSYALEAGLHPQGLGGVQVEVDFSGPRPITKVTQ